MRPRPDLNTNTLLYDLLDVVARVRKGFCFPHKMVVMGFHLTVNEKVFK